MKVCSHILRVTDCNIHEYIKVDVVRTSKHLKHLDLQSVPPSFYYSSFRARIV